MILMINSHFCDLQSSCIYLLLFRIQSEKHYCTVYTSIKKLYTIVLLTRNFKKILGQLLKFSLSISYLDAIAHPELLLLITISSKSSCQQCGQVVKAPGSRSTQSRFKTHSCHSVVSLGKTLYGTFPCLVVLASSSKLQSYLY